MTKKHNVSPLQYDLHHKELLYQGVFSLTRYHVAHSLFKGGMSPIFTREILEREPAAAVLPYDPDLDQIVLIEQFRAGALNKEQGPWLLEIVAGIYNEHETPREVARREAKEEANCDILALYPIYDYFVSPGGSNEYIHLFIGRIDAKKVGGVFGLAEEHEDIKAIVYSREEAFQLLAKGQIKTAPAIICLQWLQLNRDNLKSLWQIN